MWIRFRGLLGLTGWIVVLMPAAATPARADLIDFQILRGLTYSQTSNAQPTTEVSASFSVESSSTAAGDFTAMTMSAPSGGPYTLTHISPTSQFWQYADFNISSRAAMDAKYPLGSYKLSATGGTSGPKSSTIAFTQPQYPTTVPFVTNFTSLQGVDTTKAFTVNWNTFLTGSFAGASPYIAFALRQVGSPNAPVNVAGLPLTTTSYALASNTLLANTKYSVELDFISDYFDFSQTTVRNQRFSYTTTGTFTTASSSSVPEPSMLVLFLTLGTLVGTARLCRGRSHDRAAPAWGG